MTTTVTIGHNVTMLEVGGKWTGLEGKGRESPGNWRWQTMRTSGTNLGLSQCSQGPLDPDSGTELRTLETKLAKEDKEGGGPTIVPVFRAAEQPSQTQFQIFSVSLSI